MRNRSRSTTDQSKVQLTRRNSYRDFASIHKSKPNEYLRISTANMLDGPQRIPTNRFPSETLPTSCILVAFICFILTGSINIALLRQHCTLNLCSSISGVFPNNQDHRIQFIVEDTRQILATDCKCQLVPISQSRAKPTREPRLNQTGAVFASKCNKVFLGNFFLLKNKINIQTKVFLLFDGLSCYRLVYQEIFRLFHYTQRPNDRNGPSLLCRDMIFYSDIVPSANYSSSNSIGYSSSEPIVSAN